MEEEIAVLVHYGGEWDSKHNFNNFIVDGITLKLGSNLDTILDEITKILGVYATIDTVEIKYSVKHNYTPMKIYNDRSLKWYLDLKRKSSFIDFPLSITLKEKDCDGIMSNSNSINSSSTSTQDLQLVHCAEVSDSLMLMDENYSHAVMKIDEDGFHKEVKKGQLYANKEILQDVLNYLAIRENFQFKVERSSSTRYYLVCVDDQCSWYFKSSSLNKSSIFKGGNIACLLLLLMVAAYRGTILTACTQDAAGKILALAFAVVDSENDASWKWFFERIRETYGTRESMSIVSDRHESIFNATSIVYPGVPHCVCLYHLWGNVKKNFRKNHKLLRSIFFAMATVYTTEEFDQYMAETYKIDRRVKEYLFDIGYHRWSIAHSTVNRFMVMTSNIAESVNAADKDGRDLPIYDLLDYLMKMVGRWNNTNRNEAIATGTKYENLMREKMKESHRMTFMMEESDMW